MQLTYRNVLILLLPLVLVGSGCDLFKPAPPPGVPAPTTPASNASGGSATGSTVATFKPAVEGVEWYAHYLGLERVGYGEHRCSKEADGTFKVLKKEHLTFMRNTDRNEMIIEATQIEAADGTIKSLTGVVTMGPQPQKITATVDGDKLVVTLDTGRSGAASTFSVPWSADIRGVDAIDRTLAAQPMQPGEIRKLKCVEVIPGSVVVEEVTLTSRVDEQVDLLNHERKRLLRIEALVDVGKNTPPLKSLLWTDEKGRVVKTEQPLGAMKLLSYASTENESKKANLTPPDLLQEAKITVRELASVYEAPEMKYRATLSSDEEMIKNLFPTDLHQEWKPISPRSGELVVVRSLPGSAAATWKAPNDPPAEADSKPSKFIESDDAEVKRLAAAAAPADVQGDDLAVALEAFVHKKMTKRNFNSAMETAAGVARSGEGDCTEHAVLLAGLARARGLPARVAVGLVYSDYPSPGFYYHMWTEVYADRWIPLDATLALGGITAGHLKLSSTALSDEDALASFLPVGRVMGKLAIEAETVPTAAPAAP